MREYGLDLRVEVGRSTPRRLWALIKGLRSDSATWAGESRWTRAEELMAQTLEYLDGWGHINAVVAGADPKKLPRDARDYAGIRIQRPEDSTVAPQESKPNRISTTDTRVIAQWFAQHH